MSDKPFWNSHHAAPVQSHHFKCDFGGIDSFAVKSVTLPSFEIGSSELQVGNQIFKYPGVGQWNDVTMTLVETKYTLGRLLDELTAQRFYSGVMARAGQDGVIKTRTIGPEGPGNKNRRFNIRQHKTYTRAIDKPEKKRNGFMRGLNSALNFLGVRPQDNETLAVGASGPPLVQDSYFGIERAAGKDGQPGTKSVKNFQVANHFALINPWIKSVNFGTHDYSSDELITMEIVITYDWAEIVENHAPGEYR